MVAQRDGEIWNGLAENQPQFVRAIWKGLPGKQEDTVAFWAEHPTESYLTAFTSTAAIIHKDPSKVLPEPDSLWQLHLVQDKEAKAKRLYRPRRSKI